MTKDRGTIRLIGIIFTSVSPGLMLDTASFFLWFLGFRAADDDGQKERQGNSIVSTLYLAMLEVAGISAPTSPVSRMSALRASKFSRTFTISIFVRMPVDSIRI